MTTSGNLTLISSTLSDKTALDAANWGGGGAIYNAGTLNLMNSTLVTNAVTTVAPVTGLNTTTLLAEVAVLDNWAR